MIYFPHCSYNRWQVSWPLLDLIPHVVGFHKLKEF